MTVYVDPLVEYRGGRFPGWWCHMMVGAGDDLEELHHFAESIGLSRWMFQDKHNGILPHYDLTESKRFLAVSGGAISVSQSDMLRQCRRKKVEDQ